LLGAFRHDKLNFDDKTPEYFHPGRSARAVLGGETVARFGQLHPDVAAARKLRQDVFLAEIMLERKHGPHAFRHARAVGLLNAGIAMKSIGDVLGHRSPDSTAVYLKLATAELRAVGLEIPAGVSR